MKRQVSLYMDWEIFAKAKTRYGNVSQTVEELLRMKLSIPEKEVGDDKQAIMKELQAYRVRTQELEKALKKAEKKEEEAKKDIIQEWES